MDPRILTKLEQLKATIQERLAKEAWEAASSKAAQVEYDAKAQLLMEGAPHFFRELASHWEGMEVIDDKGLVGIQVEGFTFTLIRVDPHIWYKAQGAIDDQRALEVPQLDLTFGFPHLVLDCLGHHYARMSEAGV